MAGAGGGNVPVLFASLGSAGHDARLSAPQPRASCLHESRLIGQRAPPFKTASSPGHWLRASCILNRHERPLGAAVEIIHSNRTTRRRWLWLPRQNRGIIIFWLSHRPRAASPLPSELESQKTLERWPRHSPRPRPLAWEGEVEPRFTALCSLLGAPDPGSLAPSQAPSPGKPPGADRQGSIVLYLCPAPCGWAAEALRQLAQDQWKAGPQSFSTGILLPRPKGTQFRS